MAIELTDAAFAELIASGKPVVIDFWAPWCGPCKMMLPRVEELAEEYKDQVAVCKMNIDENEETPASLGIMSIPTMLFFKNGELVNSHTGACPKAELQALIEQLL